MSGPLFLSRARLRAARGEALSSIAPILLPDAPGAQAAHAHRLVWLLFQDIPDATRDFLWRAEPGGKYMILSRRPPTDEVGLFDLDTTPFEPALAAGDRLLFSLRANPTIARKDALDPAQRAKRARGKRVDVVMDALYRVPRADRAKERDRIAGEAATAWLTAQGERAGFKLSSPLRVDGYTQLDVERRKGRDAGVSIVDLRGELAVTEPGAFLDKLARGFGAAKAFGNGLMLIRRA